VVAAEITDQYKEVLLHTPLFKGLTVADLDSCLAMADAAHGRFAKGEIIYHRNHYERRLGIILEGCVKVNKVLADGQKIIMNILSEGNLVGGATLFHNFDYYVVEIIATMDTNLLFLSQAALDMMFQADYRLARNYISYLSSRIYFLNQKIDRFTQSSAERKLLDYLADNVVESDGGHEVCLLYSMKDLAAALNISRASLYRVLDNLEKEGIIQKKQNCIRIQDINRII
jgi:CRP-like cAMP-binding protein